MDFCQIEKQRIELSQGPGEAQSLRLRYFQAQRKSSVYQNTFLQALSSAAAGWLRNAVGYWSLLLLQGA